MSFNGALSARQGLIWSLRRKGLEPVAIAKELKTSRQFVHQTLIAADARVSELLTAEARANRIEMRLLDVHNGILVGYHRGLGKDVVISLSGKHGVQVWYWYDSPACKGCEQVRHCRDYLLDEAEERGIRLSGGEKGLPPARLARVVFSRLIPGLKR